MKSDFFEFFKPDKAEEKQAWKDGIFAFDTNMLLNLYRYSQSPRDNLLQTLSALKDQLWLPHQIAFEYHRNRLKVISDQLRTYDRIVDLAESKLKALSNDLEPFNNRHSTIDIEKVRKKFEKVQSEIKAEFDKLKGSHNQQISNDNVLKELVKLFDGKVGKAFSNPDIEKLFTEGEQRYKALVPPGYMDATDKKDSSKQSLYGDYIIWKQLIAQAKSTSKPVVFVTDDSKEDWWEIISGRTYGPRKELLREFNRESNQKIYLYQSDSFFTAASDLGIIKKVEDAVLTEVRDVRKEREEETKRNTNFMERYMEEAKRQADLSQYPYAKYMFETQNNPWRRTVEEMERRAALTKNPFSNSAFESAADLMAKKEAAVRNTFGISPSTYEELLRREELYRSYFPTKTFGATDSSNESDESPPAAATPPSPDT